MKKRPKKGDSRGKRPGTTSVDRRLVEHTVQAVPGDVREEVIKGHLNNKARSHNLIRELLGTDPTKVNLELFAQALKGTNIPVAIREFASSDMLEQVKALGGQFGEAWMTEVPGGETFDQQRDRVIKFWSSWHWEKKEKVRLTIEPSIASQVIYFPNLIEGSLGCTYDKIDEEGKLCADEIRDSLPHVAGLRWIVGNPPTVTRVLANHLQETGEYLLPNIYTWTNGKCQPQYGLRQLVVGGFHGGGVGVGSLRSGHWDDVVGLFVLGVPD
ncbi:hypothetical protein HY404_02845 [Candidatus Microgenomates bacterium]|nr:hypothetical protein [Candidatus Microgenomates bacterium]